MKCGRIFLELRTDVDAQLSIRFCFVYWSFAKLASEQEVVALEISTGSSQHKRPSSLHQLAVFIKPDQETNHTLVNKVKRRQLIQWIVERWISG